MSRSQPGVLAPVPIAASLFTLQLAPGADVRAALACLAEARCDEELVLGLGEPLLRALGATVPGLRVFPAMCGPAVAIPSTQAAVWAMVRGADPGALVHRARGLLGPFFRLDEDILSFRFAGGRDLSGYEDGTENPKGDRAHEVAIVEGAGDGLDGSSFVAAQRWLHDLTRFERLPQEARDRIIGRRHQDNEEIADAPPTAHVKRSAQESFAPEAFMLRRSLPWGTLGAHGLYFVAYGASLDPFERVLRRMVGLEDGVVDALLDFTRPVSGGYYWCPPVKDDGRLDLRAVQGSSS